MIASCRDGIDRRRGAVGDWAPNEADFVGHVAPYVFDAVGLSPVRRQFWIPRRQFWIRLR
jgi:hypothetical protein